MKIPENLFGISGLCLLLLLAGLTRANRLSGSQLL